MSERRLTQPENIIRKTRGIIKTSPSHPIHNKVVDLYVINEHAGINGTKTRVITKEKVKFDNDIINIYDYHTKSFRTRKLGASYEYVEGYLDKEIREVQKGNRIWFAANV